MTSVRPHQKAKALKPSSRRPAKELCSECGLCDTYYSHYVKEACAFLNQQIAELEELTHGRDRNLDFNYSLRLFQYPGSRLQCITARIKM
jgi:3,8-divinyl protochlorophyllide a 8-vinyl-reductase (ferredoxin)